MAPPIVYAVYLGGDGATLLAKVDHAVRVWDGASPRLVVANLDTSSLERVSRERFGLLRRHLDVGDPEILASMLAKVREFMPTRNSMEAPFHGVLTDGKRKKQFSPRRQPGSVVAAAARAQGEVSIPRNLGRDLTVQDAQSTRRFPRRTAH